MIGNRLVTINSGQNMVDLTSTNSSIVSFSGNTWCDYYQIPIFRSYPIYLGPNQWLSDVETNAKLYEFFLLISC